MAEPIMLSGGDRVVRAAYRLHQQFRYEYPGPIEHLRHRFIVAPPTRYGDQVLVSDALRVTPDLPLRWETDTFGNAVVIIEADRVEASIQLDYEAQIERHGHPEQCHPEPSSCHPEQCQAEASRSPVEGCAPTWIDEPRFRDPSPLTAPTLALREAAEALMVADDGCGKLASYINVFVAEHMRYVNGVTSVHTTAAEAFAHAAGVCQDYAQVMIALCRLCGIPARYVSGHLLGEGGTHAWVEVIEPAPGTGEAAVVAYDPTHARRANLDYVFIAAGRDYADVAPTSGRFVAPYIGRFTTTRRVDVVSREYAA